MSIHKLYRSGFVQRYHTNPELARYGQTNGQHQWSCVALLMALFPKANRSLILQCAFHDVGEIDAGDLAAPFKRSNPEFALLHGSMETVCRKETLGAAINDEIDLEFKDTQWLGLVDRLEALLYTITCRPDISNRRGWEGCEAWCLDTAKLLGCRDKVRELIDAARTY